MKATQLCKLRKEVIQILIRHPMKEDLAIYLADKIVDKVALAVEEAL